MAITLTLEMVARERMVYRCNQDGVISSPPVPADGQATVNDFLGDVISVGVAGAADSVGQGMRRVARASRDGLGQLAAGPLVQNQIRQIMLSDFTLGGAIINSLLIDRCIERVSAATTGAVSWGCDAGSDPNSPVGFNDPSPIAISEVGVVSAAYLTVEYRHSRDR